VKLLREAKIDPRPFIIPFKGRSASSAGDYQTPESAFRPARDQRGIAPPAFHEFATRPPGDFQPRTLSRAGFNSPSPRNPFQPVRPEIPFVAQGPAQGFQAPQRFAEPAQQRFRPGTRQGGFFGELHGGPGGEQPRGGREFGGQGIGAGVFSRGVGLNDLGQAEGIRIGRRAAPNWGQMGGVGEEQFGRDPGIINGRQFEGQAGFQAANANWGPEAGQGEVGDDNFWGRDRRVRNAVPEQEVEPANARRRLQGGNYGAAERDSARTPGPSESRGERVKDRLEARRAALEMQRQLELAHAGTSTKIRRMLSSISPAEHPGIYSTVDQFATLYECPPSHRGPMCLAGAAGGVLKEPHIKLAFLA
jgi:hypothetical protein